LIEQVVCARNEISRNIVMAARWGHFTSFGCEGDLLPLSLQADAVCAFIACRKVEGLSGDIARPANGRKIINLEDRFIWKFVLLRDILTHLHGPICESVTEFVFLG
jgi:hypothetical protein